MPEGAPVPGDLLTGFRTAVAAPWPWRRPYEDVAVSGDGRTAYVPEGLTRDGYGNGVTVVDLTGEHRPFELAAGTRPLGIAFL